MFALGVELSPNLFSLLYDAWKKTALIKRLVKMAKTGTRENKATYFNATYEWLRMKNGFGIRHGYKWETHKKFGSNWRSFKFVQPGCGTFWVERIRIVSGSRFWNSPSYIKFCRKLSANLCFFADKIECERNFRSIFYCQPFTHLSCCKISLMISCSMFIEGNEIMPNVYFMKYGPISMGQIKFESHT